MAYVSPLPPARSGISNYSAELLPELSRYYEIDVIIDQESVADQWIHKNLNIVHIQTFAEDDYKYDRILYHFGNSHYHMHMFNLLLKKPGVVVLHDFYLSNIINYMNSIGYDNNTFEDELFYSHGNAPFNCRDCELTTDFPSNKKILDYAKGIIVHSDNSKRLAKEWYGKMYGNDWSTIPLLRIPPKEIDQKRSRERLHIPQDAFVVATFGLMSATKLNLEIIEAWTNSSLSKNKKCFLVFVGEPDSGNYGNKVQNAIEESEVSERIKITGWINSEEFKDYLAASDIGIQLRTLSRGETSATALDCMNYGLATIVNANGSLADLSKKAVLMLPDKFTKTELVDALELLYRDEDKRMTLGRKAMRIIRKKHTPSQCAKQYAQAIETYYANKIIKKEGLVELKMKVDRAEESEARAMERAAESEARAIEAERRANDALHHYRMATSSLSWKITKPLRYLMKHIKTKPGIEG